MKQLPNEPSLKISQRGRTPASDVQKVKAREVIQASQPWNLATGPRSEFGRFNSSLNRLMIWTVIESGFSQELMLRALDRLAEFHEVLISHGIEKRKLQIATLESVWEQGTGLTRIKLKTTRRIAMLIARECPGWLTPQVETMAAEFERLRAAAGNADIIQSDRKLGTLKECQTVDIHALRSVA